MSVLAGDPGPGLEVIAFATNSFRLGFLNPTKAPLCQRVTLIAILDLCESLYRYPSESKCGVGALACAQIQYGQPRAAILHETFAAVSISCGSPPFLKGGRGDYRASQ